MEGSQCEQQRTENLMPEEQQQVRSEQPVFISTPIVPRIEYQTTSGEINIQPPMLSFTPIVSKTEPQTSGGGINTQQPVFQ